MNWAAPSSNNPAVLGYHVYVTRGSQLRLKSVDASTTRLPVLLLEPDTAYDVRVRARTDLAAGPWSGTARARTNPLQGTNRPQVTLDLNGVTKVKERDGLPMRLKVTGMPNLHAGAFPERFEGEKQLSGVEFLLLDRIAKVYTYEDHPGGCGGGSFRSGALTIGDDGEVYHDSGYLVIPEGMSAFGPLYVELDTRCGNTSSSGNVSIDTTERQCVEIADSSNNVPAGRTCPSGGMSGHAVDRLTARFVGVPRSHDGESEFTLRVAFIEDVGISPTSLREDALTVTRGTVTQAQRVDDRSDLFEITAEPDSDEDVTITLAAGSDCAAAGAICTEGEDPKKLYNSPAATVSGPTLTASFQGLPSQHDGETAFSFRIAFSEEIATGEEEFRDHSVEVWGGRVTRAEPVDQRRDLWEVEIEPALDDLVMISLRPSLSCDETGAVCTAGGRRLSVSPATMVAGPSTWPVQVNGEAQVGKTLTADPSNISDRFGVQVTSMTYQWLADNARMPGAGGSTYTPGEGKQGKTISVMATFTDDRGNEDTVTSGPTDPVAARERNSRATGLPLISGRALVGQTLTADTSLIFDADGLENSVFSYLWEADDDSIPGATDPTYTPVQADVGKVITVIVSFLDDAGYSQSMTSPATLAVTTAEAAAAVKFAISLRYAANADGSVSLYWNAPGDEVTGYRIDRRRYSMGEPKGLVYVEDTGSTATAYTDTEVTAGAPHSYRVQAIRGAELGEKTKFFKTKVFPLRKAVNSPAAGSPAISGVAQVGETLTADTSGIVDADGLEHVTQNYLWGINKGLIIGAVYGYQWLAEEAEIEDATGSTYILADADEGKAIRVRVSFTDDGGHRETLTSSATAAVTQPNAPATGLPTVSGKARVGETLTVDTSGISDENGLDYATFTHRWITDDSVVVGAGTRAYTPTGGDQGKAVKVRVSFTDDAGNWETRTSTQTAAVEARANSPATGLPTISGTAQVGETLTADTSGIEDADGLENAAFAYQWLADDSDIAGATGFTYILAGANEGKSIKAQVTFTDDAGNEETLTSPATDAVEAEPQLNIAITSDPDDDDSTFAFWYDEGVYGIGDEIEVTVTFNEDVTVTGSPRLELTIGSSAKNAAYKSANGSKVVFGYTVAVGDNDTDGVAIGSNRLTLNGGSIRDAADNTVNLSHSALSAQFGHKVDGIRPTIIARPGFVASTFSRDGVHTVGEYISARVRFSEEVIGIGWSNDGRPRLGIDIGGATKYARYHPIPINDWRDETLRFMYQVVKGDLDLDGISVAENSVELNGGTIRDAAGNDAILTHSALPANDNFIVDGVPPTVSSITITSDPGDDDAYGVGDTIEVTVTFSEAVVIPRWRSTENGMTVTRMPRLELNIGGVAKSAKTHERENITGAAIVFRYTVQDGDNDSNGISISANKLTLNGGTIRDANGTSYSGGNPADLTHTALDADSGHKVDTIAGPPKSRDATLSALSLKSETSLWVYAPPDTTENTDVANYVSSVTVTALVNHSGASYVVRLGGVTDADGTVSLAVGSNDITVVVTAEDGSTTKTYTVTVTRAVPSTDATLSYVLLSGIDIGNGLGERAYAQAQPSFSASVYNSISQTTVTPTLNHSAASYVIKLGGVTDADGVIPLAVGSNVIAVEVTAEDGQATKTYTATVNRAAASAPTTGELATDDPPVNFRTNSYTHSFIALALSFPRNRGITGVVTQRYEHDGDNFVSAGADGRYEDTSDDDLGGLNLSWTYTEPEPDTLYKWIVQLVNSQDATVIETSLEVRTPPEPGSTPLSSDATLSDLTLTGVDFEATDRIFVGPGFNSTVISYVGSVANSVTETTVTATTRHSSATYAVKLGGVADADGTVSLAVGRNVITVEVTAEDGETTRTYTVTVTRVSSHASTDATLRGLVLSDVDYGTFAPNTTTYTAQVANSVAETLVTPSVSHWGASYVVKLGGVTDINRRISLAVGSNVITVEVTAEDLVTTKTYTITVTRAAVSATAPDLVVSSVSIGSSPFGDPSFTLHATAHNQGSGSSGSTTLRYYLSADSTITSRDLEIGTDAVGGLHASGSSEESIDLIEPSAPGTYHYGACVDTVSDELETTNNCSSVAVRVNVAHPNSLATGAPIITGTAQVGQILTADTSGIADSDGLTNVAYDYQWLADDTEIAGATGNSYVLTSAELGKAVKVRVSFTDDAGNEESLTSAATDAVAAAPPPPPDNVRAVTQESGAVELTWEAPQDATVTGYRIERSRADENRGGQRRSDGSPRNNHTLVEDTGSADTGYTDESAEKGVEYEYRVSARNEAGTGEASEWVRAGPEEEPVLGDGPPGAPGNLTVTAGDQEITLSWEPPADNGNAPATRYRIEWRIDGKDYKKGDWGTSGNTTYTKTDLANGVKYVFRVKAENGSGNSYGPYGPASEEVSATPTSGSAVDLGTPVLSNTKTLHHGMVRLDWEDIEDAGWYVVHYYHVKSGEWLDLPAAGVDIAFHGSSAVVSNLHGLSWLRVRAMSCAGESEWSQIEELYGTKASDWEGVPVPEVAEGDQIDPCPVILGTPVLSNTKTLHHGMVRLDWEDIEDAGWYVVQYYHVKSGEWLDLPAAGVDIAFHGSSAVVSNLHGLSWLRVRAMSCAGESEWSQIEELYGTKASDWEGVPVPEVAESDEIEPCSEDADTSDNSPATGAPTISGTAQVGEVLEVDTSGIADADGFTDAAFTYQWLADDVDISGATGSTYTLTDSEEGKAVKIEVSFTDDEGNNETLTSAATDAVAAAPTTNTPATGAPTITGTAQVGETLTANTSGVTDADGLSSVQYEYQWLANDSDISGATSATYTLVAEDEGKAIKVKVSFTDDADNEETLTSGATDEVAARPNSPATGAPAISGTAQVGETLTANTSGIADADGLSNVQYEYQWLADDSDISGAANTTYTPVSADEGKTVTVRVSFTDDAGNGETLTSAATDAVAAAPTPNSPATGAPTISGTAQVGETLTADTSGIADEDGLTNATYSFQWLTDDTEIAGATSLTYTLADTDEGKAIKVEVSFTDDSGNDESLTSVATDAVAAAEPSEPPTKPRRLSATASHDSVTLTWDDPGDDSITGYVILRRLRYDDPSGHFDELVADTGTAATTYADNTVAANTDYTYRIKAINGAGTSERSRWFHIKTPAPPVPDKPRGLEATASHGQVILTWDDPQDDSITGYVILRRHRYDDPSGHFDELVADTGTAATTYTDDTVEASTHYTYRIKAINEYGVSERSRWFHIATPAAP